MPHDLDQFDQVARVDERRGVWMRSETPARGIAFVELCAGRDGDELHVVLQAGVAPTHDELLVLSEIIRYRTTALTQLYPTKDPL